MEPSRRGSSIVRGLGGRCCGDEKRGSMEIRKDSSGGGGVGLDRAVFSKKE